jgi:hypothetical protein
MPYADPITGKKLAGMPEDVTDSDILAAVSYGDSRVEAETGHANWTVDDPSYPLVKEASEYFLSSWIRDRFNDPERQGDKHYQKAIDICDSIRKSSVESVFVMSSQYRTFPLDINAPIYRSLPGAADSSNRDIAMGDDSDVTG